MKHSHCHCGLKDQIKKFKAGKLGILGLLLIIGHLLFHVAECLIIPAIIVAINHHNPEVVEEPDRQEVPETTFVTSIAELEDSEKADFLNTLEYMRPLRR